MAACCTPLKANKTEFENSVSEPTSPKTWLRLGFAALIAAQSMIFGLAINESPPTGTERVVLHSLLAGSAVLVFILVGLPLVKQAWASVRRGQVSIEQMFLVGIFGAFCASVYSSITGLGAVYYEVVAVLVAIYTLGSLVTVNRRQAALKAADTLREDFNQCVRLTCCGSQENILVQSVKKGDQIIILAGQGIPVDGVIREGAAFVQETALTGEPFPVVKKVGDRVLAGSYVLDARLVVEALSSGYNRQLDRLLNVVTEARLRSSGIQRQADRIIQWFLPSVIAISIGTFFFWMARGQWQMGIFNSLAVLVVACPCAMGLATPIGIWNTLNAFARRGLIVHTGDLIEKLSQIDTVIFDKTGTLSDENLQVVEWMELDGENRGLIQEYLSQLQSLSAHPVARAFQKAFPSNQKNADITVSDFKVIPRVGVEAVIRQGGVSYRMGVGNEGVLPEGSVKNQEQLLEKSRGDVDSVMKLWIKIDDRLVALALVRETLRDSGKAAILALEKMGLNVEIMSGDRPERLSALGFPLAQAGLLPEEKAQQVERLQAEGRKVLFVGDGINDAPAMTVATASIALSSGAELTQHSAQAKLCGGDLMMIPGSIALSLKVAAGIKKNLWFAGCYNAVGIVLAMTGILHPAVAAILMLASSLTVTYRALRFGENLEEALDEAVLTAAANLRVKIKHLRRSKTNISTSYKGWLSEVKLVNGLIGFGVLVQAFWVIEMGQFTGLGAALTLLAFFGAAGGAVFLSVLWRFKPEYRLTLLMLCLGNLGMLIGWSADVGFKPVIEHGSCLCGCALSHMGMGKVWGPSWMQAGMLLASLPLAWGSNLFQTSQESVRVNWKENPWMHVLVCLSGMMLGMWLAELSLLLVHWSNPILHFLTTYLWMSAGMLIGMVVFCRSYLYLVLGRTKVLNE